MLREDFRSLRIAEALLAFQAAVHPELTDPCDTDGHLDPRSAVKPIAVPTGVLTQLVEHERRIELEYADCGYQGGMPFRYDLALMMDYDMNVTCVESAIIDDTENGTFGIVLSRPMVDGLIQASRERPLGDKVRLFSYLVRMTCQLVGGLRGLEGFGGDAVCFFRSVVRILHELVGFARLEQGDDAGYPADGTDRTADGTESGPEDTPIHNTDSSRAGNTALAKETE
ncbi:hypothetical protein BISA_0875 [Bifidobacterium saguini DSM 23967]|uniref:Uncharacterized protein n=1 Tax=Bifidobacterium saguini DSM 23967 TaxID=1437607 RepID=A0A087DAC3_9BIFI|nr:hypothetical protein BISA_0875 [Bifidobacterium saguini DSM 23967]